jgi:hypothetical protein
MAGLVVGGIARGGVWLEKFNGWVGCWGMEGMAGRRGNGCGKEWLGEERWLEECTGRGIGLMAREEKVWLGECTLTVMALAAWEMSDEWVV